jgi:hypothetical protein
VYLSGSFATSSPIWTQSDAEVFNEFFKHLLLLNPTTVREDIYTWRLTRTRYAVPNTQPVSSLLAPLLPGLYVSSMAMVSGSSEDSVEFRMDACVAMARETSRIIANDRLKSVPNNTGYATIDRIY